jgi:peroxiredoxin
MACEREVEATEEVVENSTEIKENEMEATQAGVLVLKNMPEFKAEAYNAETGHYTEVSSEDYKGKWSVICFYPADFTFVCPTEIAAMNASLDVIKGELGCEVLAVSTDTKFSHKRFAETEPLLKDYYLDRDAIACIHQFYSFQNITSSTSFLTNKLALY